MPIAKFEFAGTFVVVMSLIKQRA